MVLVLVKYISCINGGYRCHSGASHQLLVIFLVVESILFGLFTLCMLGDQVSAIQSNQTQIDRLKNTKATTYQNEVNEVCGSARTERFQWQWLLPVKVLSCLTSLSDLLSLYSYVCTTTLACSSLEWVSSLQLFDFAILKS